MTTLEQRIAKLAALPSSRLEPGASAAALERLAGASWPAPAAHAALLRCGNGGQLGGGYWRLFGIVDGPVGLLGWNDDATWQFAWPDEVRGLVAFAHDVFGDQLAYRRDGAPAIFRVDGEDGTVERVASGFDELLAAPWVNAPSDERWPAVSRRFGPLPVEQVLAYVPSPLLGGPMANERLTKMKAVAAMIVRGDIVTQVRHAPADARVERLEPYVDAQGRGRMRLVLQT